MGAMELFSLAAKVVLDKADFDKGVSEADKSGKSLADNLSKYMEKAKKVVSGIFTAVAIKKAATYLWDLANETAAAGDRIDKMSQSMGLSRKAFQEWDYIMSQSGASMEDMSTALRYMGQNIAENSAETAAGLSQLGLSAAHLQSLQPEQQFEKIVRAFQQMPPSAEKSRLAMQIFGKNATSLMPLLNSSADSIDELRAQAEKLGLVMSDEDVDAAVKFGDALDDLQRTWTSFKYKFGAKMLPAFTSGFQTITESVGNLSTALVGAFKSGDWGVFFSTLSTEIERFLPKVVDGLLGVLNGLFENADKFVSLAASFVTGLVDGITASLPILLEKLPGIMETIKGALVEITPKLGQAMIDSLNALFGLNIPEFQVIVEWVQERWDEVMEAYNAAINWFSEVIPAIILWSVNAFDAVSDAYTAAVNWFSSWIPAVVYWVVKAWEDVENAYNNAINWFTVAIPATIQWFLVAWEDVSNAYTAAMNWFASWITATIHWVVIAWEDVKTAYETVMDWTADAAVGIIYWSIRAWEDVQNAFRSVLVWTANAYNATVQWFNNAWDLIVDAFIKAGMWTVNAFNATVQWFNNAWEWVENAFIEAGAWAGRVITATIQWFSNAWDTVKDAFTAAGDWVNKIINVFVNWISGTWNDIKGAFDEAGQWINKAFWVSVTWLNDTWNNIKGAFDEAAQWIGRAFWVTVTWLNDTWGNISGSFETAREWINKTFWVAVNWVNDTWNNVSGAFEEAGKWLTQKVIDITVSLVSTVDGWLKNIMNWMNGQGLKKIALNIGAKLVDFAETVWNWISGVGNDIEMNITGQLLGFAKTVYNWAQNGVKVAVDFFGNVGQGIGNAVNSASESLFYGTADFINWITGGSFAKGDSYVPYDNFPALLHRGEAVLTADQARDWRNGRSDGVDADRLYDAVAEAVAAAVGGIQVNMDGAVVGNIVTNQVARNMYRKQAGRRFAIG